MLKKLTKKKVFFQKPYILNIYFALAPLLSRIKDTVLWLFQGCCKDPACLQTLRWLKENWVEVILESQSALYSNQTTTVIIRSIDWETPQEDLVYLNRFYLGIWTQTRYQGINKGIIVWQYINCIAYSRFNFSVNFTGLENIKNIYYGV